MCWDAVGWIVALIWVSHLAPAVWVRSHLAVHSTPSGKTLMSRSPRQDLWGALHGGRHAWDTLQVILHPCSIHVGVIIRSPVSLDNLVLSQVLLLHPDHKSLPQSKTMSVWKAPWSPDQERNMAAPSGHSVFTAQQTCVCSCLGFVSVCLPSGSQPSPHSLLPAHPTSY